MQHTQEMYIVCLSLTQEYYFVIFTFLFFIRGASKVDVVYFVFM